MHRMPNTTVHDPHALLDYVGRALEGSSGKTSPGEARAEEDGHQAEQVGTADVEEPIIM